MSNLMCIDLIDKINSETMRPEYIMIEEEALQHSLYSFQACEYGILNLGKTKNIKNQ